MGAHEKGELSIIGKKMHYKLGRIIHERYWQLLFKDSESTGTFQESWFSVVSTPRSRTIESAQFHLMGLLYGLEEEEVT